MMTGGAAQTLCWVRHAHALHNEAQEAAEVELRRQFPGWDGSPHTSRSSSNSGSGGDGADRVPPPGYLQARRAAMFSCLNGEGVHDSRLSERGLGQLPELRRVAEGMVRRERVEVVLSSSLSRTLATAVGAFQGLGVPIVALDELREVAGAFDCERRRARATLEAEFPTVDLSLCAAVDTMWVKRYREATKLAVRRGYDVLELIAERPERSIAIVSHGAFMATGIFGSAHPRVSCDVAPPRLNCEVQRVLLRRQSVDTREPPQLGCESAREYYYVLTAAMSAASLASKL
jgi:broad specificity phosphatase PhoE